MPRTLKEILEHADEIAEQFEDYEPDPADRRTVEWARRRHTKDSLLINDRATPNVRTSTGS